MYRVYLKYVNKTTGKVKEFKLKKHLKPTLTVQKQLRDQGYELVEQTYINAFIYDFLKETLDK